MDLFVMPHMPAELLRLVLEEVKSKIRDGSALFITP